MPIAGVGVCAMLQKHPDALGASIPRRGKKRILTLFVHGMDFRAASDQKLQNSRIFHSPQVVEGDLGASIPIRYRPAIQRSASVEEGLYKRKISVPNGV